jgi:NAD(P)-dependent dehydrogenase (short-subunit alcohol dehydrogenase family)
MSGSRRVAVITGATRGIGRAIALRLAKCGMDLVISGRSTSKRPDKRLPGTLEEVVAEIHTLGATVVSVAADLTEPTGVESVLRATHERFGRCDVLVNNAAISYLGPFTEVGIERWRKATNLNLLAPVALTEAFLGGMIARGHGRILNVSSRAAVAVSSPGLPYAVTKIGLERFTVGLASELAGSGVDCICVRIDELVATEATKLTMPDATRLASVDAPSMAEAVRYVLAHSADYVGSIVTMADLRAVGALPPA